MFVNVKMNVNKCVTVGNFFYNSEVGLQNFHNFILSETFQETFRKLSGNIGNIGSIDNFA